MCGIVGYTGALNAKPILIDGLKRLEYRGYDSAGIALEKNREFIVTRRVGRVIELEKALANINTDNKTGIAHTRWATHGVPSEVNAHPHSSEDIVLVHNGIIENHAALKNELAQKGVEFESQTDTEVFVKLIGQAKKELCEKENLKWDGIEQKKQTDILMKALAFTITKSNGHYAVLLMVKSLPGVLFGIQKGAPVVVGKDDNGSYIASDLQAIIPYTKNVSFIPNGIIFKADPKHIEYYNSETGFTEEPKFETINWSADQISKCGHEHFMLKEIYEQPQVVADTLSGRLPQTLADDFLWDEPKAHKALWRNVSSVYLIACGTSYYAALVAKYYFEKWAHLPTEVDLASEFRYRSPLLRPGSVVGVISQSGETADTLAALRLANDAGITTFCICNVPASSIVRESNFHYPTKAGPEIGVASTKAFTAQLTSLFALALDVARLRGKKENLDEGFKSLVRLPHLLEQTLTYSEKFMNVGKSLKNKRTILFVARGALYPIALEGALKMKEITYRHAEGYAAGELKHGPIAMVDENLAAVVLCPPDGLQDKTLANLEEIKSRRGYIIGIGQEGDTRVKQLVNEFIEMPKSMLEVNPILYVVPLQLMAYGLALELGQDIDKPRNLAKSVTVE